MTQDVDVPPLVRWCRCGVFEIILLGGGWVSRVERCGQFFCFFILGLSTDKYERRQGTC
jgi:hypothetical protein